MEEKKRITKERLHEDILKEVCSFGAGNAAARLSKMVGKKVKIDLPEILFRRPEEGSYFLPKGEKEVVIGLKSNFGGERDGMIFLLIPPEQAIKLLEFVFDKEIKNIGEMEQSALMEISNILTGAVVGAIANFAGMKIYPQPPVITFDLPLSIIDFAIGEQLEAINRIFYTVVTLKIEEEKIFLSLTFFPYFDLAGEIWKKMRRKRLS
jgi:chemotaxis protein CheC